jgi:small multidrug resistance pump
MFAFKISGYLYLLFAVILGITSNGFLKTTNGFTNLIPTIFCIISIVLCIFCLSKVMIMIPVGFAYATYGGLTITAVTIFGILKYNQLPNIYGTIGIIFIIIGVILVNYLGKVSS